MTQIDLSEIAGSEFIDALPLLFEDVSGDVNADG